MHPGTRWPTKCWPPESFASLADALIQERQARVVFTGSPSDRPLISRIRSFMASPAEDLSGRTDLKALARSILSGRRRRHHRHRAHAPGRSRRHPGGCRFRSYGALAHRSFRLASPGNPHQPILQPLFPTPLPGLPSVSPIWVCRRFSLPSTTSWIRASQVPNRPCPAR